MFTLHTYTYIHICTHITKYLISQIMASIKTSCENTHTHTDIHTYLEIVKRKKKTNGKRVNLPTYRHLWQKRKV